MMRVKDSAVPSSAVNIIDAGTRGTNMQPPSGLEATSPSESVVPLLRFASDMILVKIDLGV